MRRRVLASILLVVAATALALGVPLGVLAWNSVVNREQTDLRAHLDSVTAYIDEEVARGHTVDQRQVQVGLPEDGELVITLPNRSFPPIGTAPAAPALTEVNQLADGGSVALSIPMDQVRSQQWTAVVLVLAAVAVSLAVGTAIALVLARRLAAPLGDAADRAARLGGGDFRVVSRRYDIAELDRMMDVLDASATDIAQLVGRERDLAENISHQLRTRLAGLRLSLEELAMAGDEEPLLTEALGQTDELVAVVDEVLAAARSRRAAGAREVDLPAELFQLQERWTRSFAAVDRSLSVDCPAGIVVLATPVRLREALSGLIDNSVQHGAGPVCVRVRPGRTVVIEVSDTGPGIPQALAGHVFDRGMSTASSTGIGLGLARAFVEADGGRLELRQASPPVFGIFLPAAVGPPG